MIGNLLKKIVGTKNEREIKRIQPLIEEANTFEERMRSYSDEELKGMTPRFKERLANGEDLDAILPEAFAAVREASRRILEHAPFRRAAHWRGRASRGKDRRDGHRRGKNPGRHAARIP